MENKTNNSQLNNSRDAVNNNVSRYKYFGNTRAKAWDAKRSFRSI